jgi:hypothetical protein
MIARRDILNSEQVAVRPNGMYRCTSTSRKEGILVVVGTREREVLGRRPTGLHGRVCVRGVRPGAHVPGCGCESASRVRQKSELAAAGLRRRDRRPLTASAGLAAPRNETGPAYGWAARCPGVAGQGQALRIGRARAHVHVPARGSRTESDASPGVAQRLGEPDARSVRCSSNRPCQLRQQRANPSNLISDGTDCF